jgi:hypothetical protein
MAVLEMALAALICRSHDRRPPKSPRRENGLKLKTRLILRRELLALLMVFGCKRDLKAPVAILRKRIIVVPTGEYDRLNCCGELLKSGCFLLKIMA